MYQYEQIIPLQKNPSGVFLRTVRKQCHSKIIKMKAQKRRQKLREKPLADIVKFYQYEIGRCAGKKGIPGDIMTNRSQKTKYVFIRYTCYYILRTHTNMTWSDIGRVFKHDHTTVIHGVDCAESIFINEPYKGIKEFLEYEIFGIDRSKK